MRRRKNQPVKLAMYGLALTLCTLGMGYAAYHTMGQPVADEFGCYVEAEASKTAVMVDVSEPRFSAMQARSLHQYFEELYNNHLAFSERLQFFTTEPSRIASVPKASIHICGQSTDSRDYESIGREGAQAGFLERQKMRLYENLMEPKLKRLLSDKPDEGSKQLYESPILEMIANVVRATKLNHGDRLVVVSDMIQNSQSARFCTIENDMPRFEVFKQRRNYRRLQPPSLDGVAIEILMLIRQNYGPYCAGGEEEIVQFYEDLFYGNGAASVNVIRLREGAGH